MPQERRGRLTLRPATREDCSALAASLRPADRAELEDDPAGWGSAEVAIVESWSMTPDATVLDAGGIVAGMLGTAVHPDHPRLGNPWLLGAVELDRHRTDFLRLTRGYICKIVSSGSFDVLYSDVDSRYAAAVRWLLWLGFVPAGEREGPPSAGTRFILMAMECGSDGVSQEGNRLDLQALHRDLRDGGFAFRPQASQDPASSQV